MTPKPERDAYEIVQHAIDVANVYGVGPMELRIVTLRMDDALVVLRAFTEYVRADLAGPVVEDKR